MKAKVTQSFDGVPAGEVYPRRYNPGDVVEANLAVAAIENGWGEKITDEEAAASTPNAQREGAGLPPIPPVPVLRAKLTKKHVHNGEQYARGLIVEGDLARLFIAEGVAEEVAPADKAVTSVPETK